jgi:hypothetical protein
MITKRVRILLYLFLFVSAQTSGAESARISRAELREAIHGWWIGQLVGNYLGFPFENLYADEPIPVLIERYHDFRDAGSGLRMNTDDRRAYIRIMADAFGGAWSDDDTDVELVTLHAVEAHGLGLDYEQVTTFWRAHINRFVWSASRIARDLMEQGHLPPATGSRALNEHWFSISSQLKTEIWGVFYAGMPHAAVRRAEWDARIMTDAWATHPDMLYAAMISAAFFEKDPRKLVEGALAHVPDGSPFARGVRELLRWRDEHPDWRTARAMLHERYYREVDGFVVPAPILGSVINGLCGVMALLYGDGDFTRTLAIATSAGYDCDNQAATIGGLLGVIHGAGAIPEHFTHDMPSRGRWSVPFNDTYVNYSRDGLPNRFSISALVDRILAVTEKAIVASGGTRTETGSDGVVYLVAVDATVELPERSGATKHDLRPAQESKPMVDW